MNKRNIRSFAFGVFITVSLIGSVYYFQGDKNQSTIKVDDAKSLLEEKGYAILNEADYNEWKEKAAVQDESNESMSQEKSKEHSEENQVETTEEKPSSDAIINYQLEVVTGMTSSEIAMILAQNQIIKDETEFANFLVNSGYQTKIQLGSYSLTNRMSLEQIAKMITKR